MGSSPLLRRGKFDAMIEFSTLYRFRNTFLQYSAIPSVSGLRLYRH